MSSPKKKWWQIWKKKLKESESELEKVTRTYKDIAKEHKKKQEFEIITLHQKIEATYKIIVRVLIGFVAVAVIIGFIKEYQKDDLIIEPLLVYEDLKKEGYDGTVVCNSIVQKMNEIKELANTAKETQAFTKQNAVKPIQMRLPVVGSGFSINSVYEQVKTILGKPPKTVSGSIIQQGKKISMTLQILGKNFKETLPNDSAAIEKLIEYAAISIIKQTEPYLLAAYYIQNKEFDKAIEISRYCLSHEPKSDDKWAYLIIGRAEFMRGNESSAIEFTKKSLQIDPKFSNAYLNWGVILQLSKKNNNTEEALKKYKTAIKFNSKYALPYVNWGYVLLTQQKYAEALEKYKTAYSLDKNDKVILHGIGLVYQKMKKYDEAIEWYIKSKTIDTKYINAYWGIIECCKEKKYGIDEQLLYGTTEDGLNIDKKSTILYFEDKILYKYIQKDNFKELFKDYYGITVKDKDFILENEKEDVDAIMSLVISFRETKNYKEALSIYQNYKNMLEEAYPSEFLYGLLVCYTALNKRDMALQTAIKFLETDKENKEYFYYNPILIPYLAHPKLKTYFN